MNRLIEFSNEGTSLGLKQNLNPSERMYFVSTEDDMLGGNRSCIWGLKILLK